MAAQHENILKVLLVFHAVILTLQQDVCTLPDGRRQSTCIRAHYCDYIINLIRQYGGRPPLSVQNTIRSYYCPKAGYVCCPDDAIPIRTTTAKPFQSDPQFSEGVPTSPNHLNNALKQHPNFWLLNEQSCGLGVLDRIINGEDALLKEFPWAVLLGYDESNKCTWECGGSLISKQFVLTAAHCIKKSLVVARLGEHTISTERDCDEVFQNDCADPVQDIMIISKIKHPLFKHALGQKNDIAILKLNSPADTTKNNVKTVCMPISPESDLKENQKYLGLTITGWGKLANGHASDVLQKALILHVKHDECVQKLAPIKVYRSFICAGGRTKTETCRGDSGGGVTSLKMFNNDTRSVLYGVVSGGVACENPNIIYPGISIDVRYYMDWILGNMS